ncbi:hypothetical protein EGM51_17000 [Verrucomicrobia bacterium S94]|nr:hypothetical protein EGM51_17000 [Verrucomicrobia bacterium S94]
MEIYTPNWPDELTNDKDFVFVHGYNVKDDFSLLKFDELDTPARLWHREIFKRLWHAGLNARYNGVIWDGTPSSYAGKKHYHHSVINAFATAPLLATYLNTFDDPVVMAHSLGNMVVGSAIVDYNADVYQYYAMDAAVALEAYGDVAPTNHMIPDSLFAVQNDGWLCFKGYSWTNYPSETYASEYYRLFKDSGDSRTNLTWRHRFADIQTKTDVFNFYSSTEDILRVDDKIDMLDIIDIDADLKMSFPPVDFDFSTPYAWQLQEMYKGLDQIPIINAPGGGISKYGGWGFIEDGDSWHIKEWFKIFDVGPRKPRLYFEKLEDTDENRETRDEFRALLQIDPLFRHEPEELFSENAAAFAAGTIGSHGGNLEYHTGDNDLDISQVKIRDWLLAKAFPSRTRPMGSTLNAKWPITMANFDMSDPDTAKTLMTDSGKWWHKDDDNQIEWRHSDLKNMPYVHVYKLYEKITGMEK